MRESLLWWLQWKNLNSIAPIAWVTITTDASNPEWGAPEIAQGRWSFPSHRIVLNILELLAAFCFLQAFYLPTVGMSVLLRLDNIMVVSYIRKQGGTRSLSLLQEAELIMSWAQKNLSNILVVYVPRVQNMQSDFLSRVQLDNNEWSPNA